jgi:hypothetical protein
MYISHQALEAMHQEVVSNSLRQSELRRLRKQRKALETQDSFRGPAAATSAGTSPRKFFAKFSPNITASLRAWRS